MKEEIMYALDSLSVNCLSKASTLNLKTEDVLPDKVAGDLPRFRLVL